MRGFCARACLLLALLTRDALRSRTQGKSGSGLVAFNRQPGITYWVAPNPWSALTKDEFDSAAIGEGVRRWL